MSAEIYLNIPIGRSSTSRVEKYTYVQIRFSLSRLIALINRILFIL